MIINNNYVNLTIWSHAFSAPSIVWGGRLFFSFDFEEGCFAESAGVANDLSERYSKKISAPSAHVPGREFLCFLN